MRAAVTAQNIQANELLDRFGLVAHVLILVTNVPLAVIFYDLFKVVNRQIALLMVSFVLVGTAVEASSLLDQFSPLTILGGRFASAFSTAQLQALASVPVTMLTIGYDMFAVFFGFYGLALGYLIFRSTFVPRVIGALVAIGGVCYLIHSFASFLTPGFAAQLVSYIQLPSLVGEGSLCLWLLVRGVNVSRWQELATSAADDGRTRSI